MPAIQIVWFKRDLRATDHRPLFAAAEAGPIIPLYVVEPELHRLPDEFIHQPWRLSLAQQEDTACRQAVGKDLPAGRRATSRPPSRACSNYDRGDATQGRSAAQGLRGVRPALRMAPEMGTVLGRGEILFRTLPAVG